MTLSLSDDGYRFIDWWYNCRGSQLLPLRSDLFLDHIPRFLPRLTVLDAIAPDRMVFRLTGTKIDQNVGLNPKGINVLEATPEADRELRSARLWHLAQHPCIGVFRFSIGISPKSRTPVTGVTVPVLSNSADAPVQLFSLLTQPEQPSKSPRADQADRVLMPDEFAYVDIGNGAPTDGTGKTMTLEEFVAPEGRLAQAG